MTFGDQKSFGLSPRLSPKKSHRMIVGGFFYKKILTNVKRFEDTSSVSTDNGIVSFDKEKDNLIIKGNNLLALQTLYNLYSNQVKLIYLVIHSLLKYCPLSILRVRFIGE